MRQVVICQFAMLQQRVDLRQPGLRPVAFGDRYSTIEIDNWRRLNAYQVVVERDNLPPVSGGDRLRLGMNGRNRSLQRVRAEAARTQGFLHQGHALVDLRAVPERAVLMLQQNQLSGGRGSRGAAGFL